MALAVVTGIGGAPPAAASITGIELFEAMAREKDAERHMQARRYDKAAEGYRAVLEYKLRRFGRSHLEVAKTLLGLARAELNLGKAEEALKAQQEALSIRTAKLAADHWLVAAVYNDLSDTLATLDRYDEAAKAMRSDIAIHEKRLGPIHSRLGGMWLRYAGVLRKSGRTDEAARAEAHGHEVYAVAPHGPPSAMPPPPVPAPAIKTVTSGAVTAHFGGEKPHEGPLRFGIRGLWFTFAGDDRIYRFKPEGELFFSDWRFGIFSPDGKRVLLLQDRFGPYHVVRTARLKDYLGGHAQPDEIVGRKRKTGETAAVHEDGAWLSNTEIRYFTVCCGDRTETIHKLHYFGYQPRSTLDLAVEYRPGLRDKLRGLPSGSGNLVALTRAYRDLRSRAAANPGRWEKGNIALGAEPREYVPSDDELLLADVGDSLVQLVERRGREKAIRELAAAGLPPDDIGFNSFAFRHADVMGTGRFYYASPPREVRLRLKP